EQPCRLREQQRRRDGYARKREPLPGSRQRGQRRATGQPEHDRRLEEPEQRSGNVVASRRRDRTADRYAEAGGPAETGRHARAGEQPAEGPVIRLAGVPPGRCAADIPCAASGGPPAIRPAFATGDRMRKGIVIAALAMGLALPVFAESDTVKDVKDNTANATDTVKDKLGTDSGAEKTKRHAKRKMRNAKKDARQMKNDAKKDVNSATK